MDQTRLADQVIAWYDRHARDLPWRRPGVGAWAVLVSEFMLQQTPVARVLGPWQLWLERWPTPAALAADNVAEAVRAWGRLGYPRRAQRLHAAARAITERHGGQVPDDPALLRALPGVGEYTAAAVAAFAFGKAEVVLDVNVRRVLSRLEQGQDGPVGGITAGERQRAARWLPAGADATRWSVAAMELGAQLCRATSPRCGDCPVADACRWRAAGRPPAATPRRTQAYAGTDRQARGAILARLRPLAPGRTLPRATLLEGWPDPAQAQRALSSLLSDGLVRGYTDGYAL